MIQRNKRKKMSWSISVKTVGSLPCSPATSSHDGDGVTSASRSNNDEDDSGSSNAPCIGSGNPLKMESSPAESSSSNENNDDNSTKTTFTVDISPDSPLSSLRSSIQKVTGLNANQQRLIYRGRLIPCSSNVEHDSSSSTNKREMRICDIGGLTSGQTIHLVPRPPPAPSSSSFNGGRTLSGNDLSSLGNSNNEERLRGSTVTSTTGTNFLATLLGLDREQPPANQSLLTSPSGIEIEEDGTPRVTDETTNNNNNQSNSSSDDDEDVISGLSSLSSILQRVDGLRGASGRRNGGRNGRGSTTGRRRRSRGGSEVPVPVRDGGSMEVVRQGMMTLHTMMHHHQQQQQHEAAAAAAAAAATPRSEASHWVGRRWYKGQWLDVKDTVNQWLEATIIDIALPSTVLGDEHDYITEDQAMGGGVAGALSSDEIPSVPNENGETLASSTRAVSSTHSEPIIKAPDLEGRKKLLLNPDNEKILRSDNRNVQLLLIHYNGWPHRWDEWIRSDSIRIRPFRTRTRHIHNASGNHVHNGISYSSPTVQHDYGETPETFVLSEDGDQNGAIIPELSRVVNMVGQMLDTTVKSGGGVHGDDGGGGRDDEVVAEGEIQLLPWRNVPSREHIQEEEKMDEMVASNNTGTRPQYNREELLMLAPLLDRLGRTLTDAAPHIAQLASSYETAENDPTGDARAAAVAASRPMFETSQSSNSLTIRTGDIETSGSREEDTTQPLLTTPISSPIVTDRPPPLPPPPPTEFATIRSNTNHNTINPLTNEEEGGVPEVDNTIDFINGMVNATPRFNDHHQQQHRRPSIRVPSTPRPDEPSMASLLAVMSGGTATTTTSANPEALHNLLTANNNNIHGNAGGIDIHIQAVLAPGGLFNGFVGTTPMMGPVVATSPTTPPADVPSQPSFHSPVTTANTNNDNGNTDSEGRSTGVVVEEDFGLFDELYGEDDESPTASAIAARQGNTPLEDIQNNVLDTINPATIPTSSPDEEENNTTPHPEPIPTFTTDESVRHSTNDQNDHDGTLSTDDNTAPPAPT